MKAQTNRKIIGGQLQRILRNRMTDAEMRLWQRLRSRQLDDCKFRRQHPYMDFILDFVCLEKCLIVEVDGGQHLENERDRERDRRLQKAGFHVLRFWNNQVLQETDAVVEAIWTALQNKGTVPHPPPSLPLEGGGTVLSPLEGGGTVLSPLEDGETLLPPLQGEGWGGDGGIG